jgi:alkylation response protein AidB-like acyl-CoA dehydrogenase
VNAHRPSLSPLLEAAFPAPCVTDEEFTRLVALQRVIDSDIAPRAATVDATGRYPTESIAALKRSGFLAAMIPTELGGGGVSHRCSLEAQVRIAVADSSVAQIYKVHDELVREILVYCPDRLRPWLANEVVARATILGLAVAESGRTVADPLTTTATANSDGGYIIDGTKIYTTGAAEADYIAVWAWDQSAFTPDNPLTAMTLNLVSPNAPGVHVHRDWDALGQRGTDSGTIDFHQVASDPALHASVPGKAPLPHAAVRYQAGFAAVLIGLGIAALRDAARFVTERSRPWPSPASDDAPTSADSDPYVRRLIGELTADLAAAYQLTMACGDLLDGFEAGNVTRTELAVAIYSAKSTASRAAVRATGDIYALMGTRAAARFSGLDRYWRNARTLSLHDPVDWKHAEIGRHVLTGWDPPPGIYT